MNKLSGEHAKTTLPSLQKADLENYKFCYPSLSEQQKIASILSTIQEAKEKTENIINALKELKKSMMKHLFTYGPVPVKSLLLRGDSGVCKAEENETHPRPLFLEGRQPTLKETEIGVIPEHWEVSDIGNVITSTQYGLSVRGNPKGKYPILRMNNIQDGYLHLKDLQYVDVDKTTYEKFKLNKGDILFNRTNSFELVGKVAIFDNENPFVFASYLIKIVTNPSKLSPSFLNYYLNWQSTQNRLKMLASRGVSQSNINATKLKGFTIILPPIPDQQQITDILSAIDNKIEAEENKKKALETLFKTLLSLLMTGKIRVKDLDV